VIAFFVLAAALILTAMFTITAKKPVYSVVGLLGNFVTLAILYLTLNAEFLAVIQIVVYSGAILILFLFVIALLSSGVAPFEAGPDKMPRAVWPAALFGLITLGAIAYTVARAPLGASSTPVAGQAGEAGAFGSVADFGAALFTKNLLPFEITALILMVAVIGVVLLAGDDMPPARRKPKARSTVTPREPIAR
jgi:NADH-quinone oxidoreductase subunit J